MVMVSLQERFAVVFVGVKFSINCLAGLLCSVILTFLIALKAATCLLPPPTSASFVSPSLHMKNAVPSCLWLVFFSFFSSQFQYSVYFSILLFSQVFVRFSLSTG